MNHTSLPLPRRATGFTLMEILVVVAIIMVLAVITLPVLSVIRTRANKNTALNVMRNLGAACGNFASQNDNLLPPEDSSGTDTWAAAADPANSKVWYNSLPRQMGAKGVGDFAISPEAYYTKENLLFMPGATYPESTSKLVRPLFAIAINTKLHRKDPTTGVKSDLRMSNITSPQKTVLFLEQGLKSEPKTLPVQSSYDGSCKGSAKSFVGRYSGQGILSFVDGHSESVDVKDTLTQTGLFPFPPTDVIWCRTPEENPN